MRALHAASIPLALALCTGLACAGSYKWVDEKGVVNYSNAPPPQATKVKAVEERLSNYETDPQLKQAIQNYRRAGYAEIPPEPPRRGVAVIGRYAYGGCTPPAFLDCPVTSYGSGGYYPQAVVYRPALRSVLIIQSPPRRASQRSASVSSRSLR